MDGPLRVRTKVLPGHRLEIVDDELPDGGEVEVVVVLLAANGDVPPRRRRGTLRDFIGAGIGAEARGLDNEQLDAELVREYGDPHEDAA